ncbi:glycoside hydrolase family 88 protein [Paenibacillus sp. J2TS4]|uniref:glycoside hydrolase family 88 protein n=1 Tax=Paenibacillus sp. J2TS4 TaxID=2807194 RepID=UPI001B135440|nr:glycoside hydrolase family 88 protein [Paenibacillus sp. J2TS4]GIP35194.1 unsaturated chondroitin disaccharide hydrolase [Paenibacillus sp. J2TS4]
MWKQAIEDAVLKTRRNIEKHGLKFPHIIEKQADWKPSKLGESRYQWEENNDWIDGFYTGMVWLCYQYTGDEFFREAALAQVQNFSERLDKDVYLDHHDIGFLYSLSAKAGWIVDKNEEARQLALRAADKLMQRWRPQGQYIQAWGAQGDPENGGRIIIDCLLNLPLLYWAYEQTGNAKYRNAAMIQADKSRRYLVRGDDSSYHTFYFNPEDGTPIRGGTHQGYHDGSTWTRGQAWGIYGFALSYRYTLNPLYLETAKRMTAYFIDHFPEDDVVYWDFDVPVVEETSRDSSASAIAAAGMLELLTHMEAGDPDRSRFEKAVQRSMESLVNNYSTMKMPEAEGLLQHGSYHVRGGRGLDDFMIWGDYYYLEALMRLEKGLTGYWYE